MSQLLFTSSPSGHGTPAFFLCSLMTRAMRYAEGLLCDSRVRVRPWPHPVQVGGLQRFPSADQDKWGWVRCYVMAGCSLIGLEPMCP